MKKRRQREKENMKKRWQGEKENEENEENKEDRLSDLPDGVLLHILSSLDTKQVVQTCVLSKRWEHLWKRISTLMLYASSFPTPKQFAMFASKILTLRDTSIPLQALDIDRHGNIEPQLLVEVLDYVWSNDTHIKELEISVCGDSSLILSCVSSCRALTSLKLDIYPRRNIGGNFGTIFPKYLNLPALTSLDLTNFAFWGTDKNGCVDPFSAFTKLNSLVIYGCKIEDAQILKISSETLVDLAMHHNSSNFSQIELSTPSLCTFTITGIPTQKICGSGLSSVKQVNIDAKMHSNFEESPMVLLSWLLDLANVKSLTVSSITLQILSLVPDLLEVELHSLCNLKSMEIKLEPLQTQLGLPRVVNAMLKKVAAKSSKEAAKLQKAFKAGLEPPPIPDGIVDFLRQNSPLAEVNILTIYSNCFNLKEVKESIKGAKIINYHSQFAASSSSSSTTPASAAALAYVAAPASAAPLNLHLCHTEKDDKSSNEDKVGKHQHNSDSPLLDNGQ